MHPLETAILRTVLYGDVFRFAMTVEEIHHFLIHDEAVSLAEVQAALARSALLRERLCMAQGYIACSPELIALRAERARVTQVLWARAERYGRWLARLPFVRMVAVTGALAMHNPAGEDDDLDYLIVTAGGRVWLARAGAVLLVRLARLRGVVICPNYVLAEDALTQTRDDLYIAHEVTQVVPLYGVAVYDALRCANPWTYNHLPNARAVYHAQPGEAGLGLGWGGLKRVLERLLSGRLGAALEAWEYRRKLRRFAREMQTPRSAARLDTTQVKGHFNDHGQRVLCHYQERLARYGVAHDGDARLPLAGD